MVLNIFRKSKKEEKRKKRPAQNGFSVAKVDQGKRKQEKLEKKQEIVKIQEKPKKDIIVSPKRKGNMIVAPSILIGPHITEKASKMEDQNDYVFKVQSNATKPEIKKAVKEVYNVDVLKVRIINVAKKSKRLGRTKGFKAGYKKAIVRIKKGQSIELMPR